MGQVMRPVSALEMRPTTQKNAKQQALKHVSHENGKNAAAEGRSVGRASTPQGVAYTKKARRDPLWRMTQRPPTGSGSGNLQYGGPQWTEDQVEPMAKLRPPPRPNSACTVDVPNCKRVNVRNMSGVSG